MDVRPGGSLWIVMKAPDGALYPMKGEYREVVEPERLVFSNIALDGEGRPLLDGLTTVTFVDVGGKMQLPVTTEAVGLVSFASLMLEGMEAGWTQNIDRLEAFVASEISKA